MEESKDVFMGIERIEADLAELIDDVEKLDRPTGVPAPFVIVAVLWAVLASASAIYFAQRGTPSEVAQQKAQAETQGFVAQQQKAQFEALAAQQHHVEAIQLEVAKQCTAKGRVPVWIGGNLDCKAN